MKKLKNIDTVEHTWLGEILQPDTFYTIPENININDEVLIKDILEENCAVYDGDDLIEDPIVSIKFIFGGIIEISYDDKHTEIDGRIRMSVSPEDHGDTHESGNGDEISVQGLNGVLAEPQHLINQEAVDAMGTKDNSNSLNHDRYQQGEITNLPETQLGLNHPTHDNSNDPTTAEKQAMLNANSPSSTNPFATMNDELVGPQGPQGPVGPQGLQGIQGVTGQRGERGESFSVDESSELTEAKVTDVQDNSGATLEDIYTILVTEDNRSNQSSPAGISGDMSGHLTSYDGTNWHDFGQMTGVEGPQGSDGRDAEDGSRWFNGNGIPVQSSTYRNKDYYLDDVTGDIYEFTSGAGELEISLTHDSGSNTCADAVMLKKGAIEIIVDNTDSDCLLTGTWNQSSGPNPYGSNSLYSSSNGSRAIWKFQLPESGIWTVRAYWTMLSSRTTTADYIYTADDGEHTATKDQHVDGGQWNDLGTHTFSVGNWSKIGNIKGPQGSNAPRSFALYLNYTGNTTANWLRVVDNNIPSNRTNFIPTYNCKVREVVFMTRYSGTQTYEDDGTFDATNGSNILEDVSQDFTSMGLEYGDKVIIFHSSLPDDIITSITNIASTQLTLKDEFTTNLADADYEIYRTQKVQIEARYRNRSDASDIGTGDSLEWICNNKQEETTYNENQSKNWMTDLTTLNNEMLISRKYAFRLRRLSGSRSYDDTIIAVYLEEVI